MGENWLPVKEISIGVGIRLALSTVKKNNTRVELFYAFRQRSVRLTYMQATLPVMNPVT